MRFLFLFGVLATVSSTVAQPTTPSAEAVLQSACSKAGKEGKKVLLIFHASWCGWCRKMDASLADPTVKPLIDKYYIIAHLTVYEAAAKKALENPGALEWITKNGGADQGLPYWFVLDKTGMVLANSQYQPGKNSGCPASVEEVAHFIAVLHRTSPLSETGLTAIGERMRRNER